MAQHQQYEGTRALQVNLALKEADAYDQEEQGLLPEPQSPVPSIFGMPLKYVSLVTLAVQNASLTLIMHYSRVSAAPSQTYSAAAAVLMTELLKGFISLLIAFSRIEGPSSSASLWTPRALAYRCRRLGKEVFRADCWKLSVPAILYVIQNNLQFVAVSNLEAATFQVSYQMKILTTAAFSVFLLRKKLTPMKWLALLFLAIGVGIVQIQNGSSRGSSSSGEGGHDMNQLKGFMAVVAACFTSGLAGVYFEMVLKNSQADLWVRNVQLSLFSLLPALLPIIMSSSASTTPGSGFLSLQLFENFGIWAWSTVLAQVLGGLLTALVIKYADNILKGFATSLSIVISFLASVALFSFHMTLTFVLGSTVVLVATWMYNQPDTAAPADFSPFPCSRALPAWSWRRSSARPSAVELGNPSATLSRRGSTSSLSSLASFSSSAKSYPGSPVERDSPGLPLLGEKKRPEHPGRVPSLRAIRVAASQLVQVVAPYPQAPPALPAEGASAASSGLTHHTQNSLGTSAAYPLSRPASALSSYPASRPASAAGSTVLIDLGQAP